MYLNRGNKMRKDIAIFENNLNEVIAYTTYYEVKNRIKDRNKKLINVTLAALVTFGLYKIYEIIINKRVIPALNKITDLKEAEVDVESIKIPAVKIPEIKIPMKVEVPDSITYEQLGIYLGIASLIYAYIRKLTGGIELNKKLAKVAKMKYIKNDTIIGKLKWKIVELHNLAKAATIKLVSKPIDFVVNNVTKFLKSLYKKAKDIELKGIIKALTEKIKSLVKGG